jgi:hypothetical protein
MHENNTQTETTTRVFASHGGQVQAEEMLYRLMKSQLGNNVLQRLAEEGVITRQQSAPSSTQHIYNAEFKPHYVTTNKKTTATTVSPPSESDSIPALPLVADAPNGLNAGGSANDIDELIQQLGV